MLWKKTGRHRGWDLGVVKGKHGPHPEPPLGLGAKWEMHLAQALVWNSSSALDRLGDRKPPFSHL